jgi:septal ring factor EnvC (AmiA/AmiB activator)
MGLGSTAKKIQKVADIAEDLYKKVNELKTQLEDLRSTVDETNDRVDGMEQDLAEQRALIEALAEERGVDTDAVVADVTADTETDAAEAVSE